MPEFISKINSQQKIMNRPEIEQFIVTAEQMRAIENRVFDAGMPVAALMEKVANLVARRISALYPLPKSANTLPVGVLVGPGHNGGDALVVARELHFRGYEVIVYCPFTKLKDLTQHHANYAASLGIPIYQEIDFLQNCALFVDGLFGFGLERAIKDPIATAIALVNTWGKPLLSIDIPSGLHTDTGAVLGTAISATHTFCLGLWKLGFLEDQALDYVGQAELIDFDLPLADIEAVLGNSSKVHRITPEQAKSGLPLPRPVTAHKYKLGHLLLICGSRQYTGAAILAGLGARSSGVGMVSMAVPESLKLLLNRHLPEALVIDCPETESGAIAHLPPDIDFSAYQAIACGPGLTMQPMLLVKQILDSDRPLLLDADGLNILAKLDPRQMLPQRSAPTILTPHPGEFRRLFPDLGMDLSNRIAVCQSGAQQSGAIVVLKGARVAIAHPNGSIYINPESTPALARGGSGDVLTGLMGGLIAQANPDNLIDRIQTAVWWHAQAGILAAKERTELGVDAFTLTQYLIPVLQA
jgi:NAD(P)H-hydrate epimerase